MAYYNIYFNDEFIKKIDISESDLNIWCDSYSIKNNIMWSHTVTENNNVYISDNMSNKKITLIYDGE